MKKIFVTLCLLYSTTSCAMSGGKIAWLVAAPVLLHGVYFGCKTRADREFVRQKMQGQPAAEIEIEVTCVPNQLIEYTDGFLGGIAPVVNVLKMANMPETMPHRINQMSPAEKTGFLNGFLLYATIPVALELLRKIK